MKFPRFIFFTLLLAACSAPGPANPPQPSASASASPSPLATAMPGGGAYQHDCVELGTDVEKNAQLANPQNKAQLSARDLGIGSDSYLGMRFGQADSDKDQLLNSAELKVYLGVLPRLANICRQI